MNLSKSDFPSIWRWIYRNARPIDLARWQYHFEGGSNEAVLAALSAYQNADGGFGHALEADSWNPNSSPYTTHIAISILEEVGWENRDHPIIRRILDFIRISPDFDGLHWAAIIPTNKEYPHAPWWADRSYDWGFTPTAAIAGFILHFADEENPIFATAQSIAEKAVDTYLHGASPTGEPYSSVRREGEIQCLNQMLLFIEGSKLASRLDIAGMKKMLNHQANRFIEKDPGKWSGYCWRPSVFVKSPDSFFLPGNEEAIDVELTYILNQRNPEGLWDITWSWGAYEKEFAISENWWKANLIIDNLRLLKSFGRFE